ncbi:hypothetical protein CDL12_25320 [Handroanthus impetiginosus]|uniref:RING-type domain-containing protein n=1 Tax=Handroanthus impetiginosus TaxID=429701 RepID=A0A2G9GAE8_9LAMI|nr:hypothetical protein CDL12_25320 [Handroanthus impetiginosus]
MDKIMPNCNKKFCCCIQTFDNFRREGTVTNQSTISQATIFNTETSPNIGLDHSILNSCSELVVLDINEDQILGLGENICCSICLEGYKAKEKVRRINLCHHCFHADCVDRWLR